MSYRCECSCQWCANLDATPCSVIEGLRERVLRLEKMLCQGHAEAAIARVRELHAICETKRGAVCRQCEDPWPCSAIRALDGGAPND